MRMRRGSKEGVEEEAEGGEEDNDENEQGKDGRRKSIVRRRGG